MKKLLFFGFFVLVLLIFPKFCFAEEKNLIINEIMYDYPGTDNGNEWVEIKNISDLPIQIDKNYRFFDGTNHLFYLFQGENTIQPNGFAILADDPENFLLNYPDFSGTIFKVSMSLSNTEEILKISSDKGKNWIDDISYNSSLGADGNGKSLEKDLDILRPSFVYGGTPGRENSTIADRIIYSQDVHISEIYSNPATGEEEYIELVNLSDNPVDLGDWQLDDIAAGGSGSYTIPKNTFIEPHNFLVFYKSQTKINLNNDGDEARLISPDGITLCSIPYSKNKKGQVYIRLSDGLWNWSYSSTPKTENVLTLSPVSESENLPDRSEIIQSPTGEASQHEGKFVELIGAVTQTSGNTFYLDDGSGEIKIYIQEKTNIDKPPMRKNDIFKIIGVVNLYRGTYRVLPQQQDDIELVQSYKKETAQLASHTREKEIDLPENIPIKQIKSKTQEELLLNQILNSNYQNVNKANNLFPKVIFWVIIIASLGLVYLLIDFFIKKYEKNNNKI